MSGRIVVRLVALFLLGACLVQAPSASSSPGSGGADDRAVGRLADPTSELRIGGRLVAYVGWSRTTNTFHVGDAYPDSQSAVVRYRIGRSTKTYHRWNSEGNGEIAKRTITALALPVKFKACRAARAERNFRCTKRWVTVGSSCLKASATKAYFKKGACVTATGQPRFGDGTVYNGWAYRIRGRISDPRANGKAARLQARTHLFGEAWSKPTNVAVVRDGRWKSYDQVLYRGGRRFFFAFRICGNGCTKWTIGDGAVGA